MNDIVLEMKHISKVFAGVRALDSVDFELKRGEVHAIIGENGAGKSTLMKILLGIHKRDGGEIIYKGEPVYFKNPHEALTHGISMVHQELSLTQSMTVSENIWLGREKEFTEFGIINRHKRQKATLELLERLNIDVKPTSVIKNLSVAYMQLIELTRAISYKPDVIVLDEPTSALAVKEIDILFDIIRKLTAEGCSVIFISHKLDEIYTICDRITVLRDGQYVTTKLCKELPMDELVQLIVGREVSQGFYDKQKVEIGQEVLRVENLSSTGVYRNINFNVHEGEIVGFYGLMGAGRTEILRAVYGLDKYTDGAVYIDGKKAAIRKPKDAVKLGIGMVTEDRLRAGIFASLSVMYNATITGLKLFSKGGLISTKMENQCFQDVSKSMAVKYASEKDTVNKLSGGNQQKVILSRWMIKRLRLLILDEPTRGIDVGSKAEIHKLISNLAAQGIAIVVISSEMPELLNTCDRIYVVRHGEMAGEIQAQDATQEVLAQYAFGTQN